MKMRSDRRWTRGLIGLVCAVVAGTAAAQGAELQCGPLPPKSGYGPYDYVKFPEKRPIVENHHFTPEQEALLHNLPGFVGSDLDYTLRVFPNHHRALQAMIRLFERTKPRLPPGVHMDVECYLLHGVAYASQDPVVRMIYANFLIRRGRPAAAETQLRAAAAMATDNPFTHFNLGLIYFEMKKYDEALLHAQQAQALGFARPELKALLEREGRWREAVPAAVAASQPAAAQ